MPVMLSNLIEGTVHEYGTPEYNALISAETRKPGSRAAIVVDIYQIGTVRIRPSRIVAYKGVAYRNSFTPCIRGYIVLRLRSPTVQLYDTSYTAPQSP